MAERRRDWLAIAAIVAVTLLLFWPTLTGQMFELRDFPRWTFPSRELWRQAILSGRIPQWNPTVGLGVPTLAIPVHGTFYPGHLLLLVAPTWWSLGFTWTVHAAFAGIGGYLLARKLGCRPSAAFIAGASFAIGGYAVSMWGDGEKVLSGAWVPWFALFLAQRRALSAAVALAMIALAGDPFLWMHAVPLGLAASWERGVIKRLAIATGLGLLLSAVALAPAFALIGDSERAGGIARDEAVMWSMHPIRLLELIAPNALGDPTDAAQYAGVKYVREAALGDNPWALGLYSGAVVALFAPWAGKRRRLLYAVAAIAAIAAMGRFTPVDRVLRVVIPPLRYMRYPEKHALLMTSALSVLAALGCERVLRGEVPLRRVPIPFLALALVAALLAPVPLSAAHAVAVGAIAFGAIVLARTRPQLTPLIPAIVAVDLVVAALPLLQWTKPVREPPALAAFIRAQPSLYPQRLYRPRSVGAELETVPDNFGEVWGIAHVPGHDAALSARFHQLWGQLSGERAMTLFAIDWMLMPGAPAGLVPSASLGALRLTRWPRAERVSPGCSFERYAPESLTIACNAATPMTMVVADAYAPGWTATVDGSPTPIQRAHEVLRGVDLPAGVHRIEMRYRTPGLTLGLVLSALGIVTALGLWRCRLRQSAR